MNGKKSLIEPFLKEVKRLSNGKENVAVSLSSGVDSLIVT